MKRGAWLPVLLLAACGAAHAQWQLQNSGTAADLRGIDNVGAGVAWASGTNGTVLRTEDGGYLWQNCAIPPGAEHLDFRGIQAFDANTAIVMSSGKGDLSRLYKTTDGCNTWKLAFTNPDKDGFWDGLRFDHSTGYGVLLGDPVDGRFSLWRSRNKGNSWNAESNSIAQGLKAREDEGVFAASNSALAVDEFTTAFVTGGTAGSRILSIDRGQNGMRGVGDSALPIARGSQSSGAFSIARREGWSVVVGGDYLKPEERNGTAACDGNGHYWQLAQTPPHGYRSAVAYDAASKTWITVGPNGTDISTDDGRNWRAVHPDLAMHEAPDADRNWNALSLPFVVGPHGRIGKLSPKAFAINEGK
jgi:photosystem II stability/assembly factor-like uncharacterized protein